MNATINRIFTNDSIFLSVSIQILCDEYYDISSRYLYLRCRMNVVTNSIQPTGSQFVIHGLHNIHTLDENSGICIPTTRIIMTPNITHMSASKCDLGQGIAVVDTVVDYREETYKTDSYIAHKNSKLQGKHENIELSRTSLDSTPVVAKEF